MTIADVEMSLSETRARLPYVVDLVRLEHQPIFITRHGHRVAAVVAAEDLERLVSAAEDLADLREAQEALEEFAAAGDMPIPWDDVRADLGLA